MNNNLIEQLKKLSNITLSKSEKERFRHALHSHMKNYETPANGSVPSPFTEHARRFILRPLQAMTMAAVIILGSGAGLTYAAQDALPGDALYNVKVNFNEEVRGWAYNNPKDKAEYEIGRAAKRLEETAQLALTGKLDADAVREVQAQITKHTQRTQREVDKITTGPSDNLEITTKLATELKAHSKALTEIKEAKNINGELSAILASTEGQINEITTRQIAAEEAVKLDNSDDTKTRLAVKYTEANFALDTINDYLSRDTSELDADLVEIERELAMIEDEAVDTDKSDTDIVTSTSVGDLEDDDEETDEVNSVTALDDETSKDTTVITAESNDAIDDEVVDVATTEEKTTSINAPESTPQDPEYVEETIATKAKIQELLIEAQAREAEGKFGEALILTQQAITLSQETLTKLKLNTTYESDMEIPIMKKEKSSEVEDSETIEATASETTTTNKVDTDSQVQITTKLQEDKTTIKSTVQTKANLQ